MKGQEHVLETVNATVSHEMRNPLNAIHCSNLKLQDLAAQLDHISTSDEFTTVKKMRKALSIVRGEIRECIGI